MKPDSPGDLPDLPHVLRREWTRTKADFGCCALIVATGLVAGAAKGHSGQAAGIVGIVAVTYLILGTPFLAFKVILGPDGVRARTWRGMRLVRYADIRVVDVVQRQDLGRSRNDPTSPHLALRRSPQEKPMLFINLNYLAEPSRSTLARVLRARTQAEFAGRAARLLKADERL